MRNLMIRLGLHCETVEDESKFADKFLRGAISESQLFLVVGAIFLYVFVLWDRIIDPVNWETSHMIRGFMMAPALLLCAAAYFTKFGRKYYEPVLMAGLLSTMVGLAWVYAVLDEGYKYAGLGFALAMLGTTAMFPIRARFLFVASLLTVVIVIVGQQLADNTPDKWLLVNLMAVLCAISFGTLSAYTREKQARHSFRIDQELTESRQRVDDLLHSMLPGDIVDRIQAGEKVIADAHGEVSIIFADLIGFTELSRKISATDLVAVLNRLFSAFDIEAERHGVERIKTIGDCYMAVGGLSHTPGKDDHAANAADFALAIQKAVRHVLDDLDHPVEIRIGLHIGPVVAGVIGVRRPAFDCWGEAVNLASRLENSARPGMILVSESAYQRLYSAYDVQAKEEVEMKGIGKARVYQLGARKTQIQSDTIETV